MEYSESRPCINLDQLIVIKSNNGEISISISISDKSTFNFLSFVENGSIWNW